MKYPPYLCTLNSTNMLFFKLKKETAPKVAKGVQIKSTVTPENRPDFNTWCRDFNVSTLYSYHNPMPHNGVFNHNY